MKAINVTATAGIVLLIWLVIGQYHMAQTNAAASRQLVAGQAREQKALNRAAVASYVYSVCNASRISPTITEQACSKAQDATNSEFLCIANNPNPDNYCWVEVK